MLATIALYGWEHAADEPRFSAGFGSGLTATGRRLGAAFVMLVAVAAIVTAFTI